jgi:hypothetical protein
MIFKDKELLAETYNNILKENARRAAAGLDMGGAMQDAALGNQPAAGTSFKEAPIFGGPMRVLLDTAQDIEHIARAVQDGTVDQDNIKQLFGIAAEMKEYYERNK